MFGVIKIIDYYNTHSYDVENIPIGVCDDIKSAYKLINRDFDKVIEYKNSSCVYWNVKQEKYKDGIEYYIHTNNMNEDEEEYIYVIFPYQLNTKLELPEKIKIEDVFKDPKDQLQLD